MEITTQIARTDHSILASQEQCEEMRLRSILNEFGGLSADAFALPFSDDLFAAGLSSFATVGVMLAIEEEFHVSFPDALLARSTFKSMGALAAAVRGMQAND